MKKISCREANSIDLVTYLEQSGFKPARIRNHEYWYLSPLREEHTPSFKVDRNKNVWYDHGIGKGGKLVDLGLALNKCDIATLLEKLSTKNEMVFFHRQNVVNRTEERKTELTSERLVIRHVSDLKYGPLLRYLKKRSVDPAIAKMFCSEVDFSIGNKTYKAIGFRNDAGAYELRNVFFKGSSHPKTSTMIGSDPAQPLLVFEGFFSFLSWKMLALKQHPAAHQYVGKDGGNFLILNSLSFLEKSRDKMEKFDAIHLYLDRDQAGITATKKALHWSKKYQDKSEWYGRYKDLNDYLVAEFGHTYKKGTGKKRSL